MTQILHINPGFSWALQVTQESFKKKVHVTLCVICRVTLHKNERMHFWERKKKKALLRAPEKIVCAGF